MAQKEMEKTMKYVGYQIRACIDIIVPSVEVGRRLRLDLFLTNHARELLPLILHREWDRR